MDTIRRLLGRESILRTQIKLAWGRQFLADDYVVKVASTIEGAVKPMEVRFEVVTEFEGKKLLKKRKPFLSYANLVEFNLPNRPRLPSVRLSVSNPARVSPLTTTSLLMLWCCMISSA